MTEWVKDCGQGYVLTPAGQQALVSRNVAPSVAAAVAAETEGISAFGTAARIVRGVFLEPKTPYVSRVLLALNVLYFAYGALIASQTPGLSVEAYLSGSGVTTDEVLRKLGALGRNEVFPKQDAPNARPQYERLILSAFLHIGLFHLFMNMYFLYSMGPLIESMWGGPRFLAIYLIATIVSGCVILFGGTPAAGASGALFGIFGSLLVWFLLNRSYLPHNFAQAFSRNLGFNLLILTAINFVPGISWTGHLGGAIGGLLAALLLHVQRFHPSRIVRGLALCALPLVPLGFFIAMLWQAGRL